MFRPFAFLLITALVALARSPAVDGEPTDPEPPPPERPDDTAAGISDTGEFTEPVIDAPVPEARSYSCECFARFDEDYFACAEHSHSFWLGECEDYTFDYTSSVPCGDVPRGTYIQNGAYYTAWYGNYAWSDDPIYSTECFDTM